MEIKCERCGQEEGQIKTGRTQAGSQRYMCNHCEKTYTPVKKERMYPEELKDRAIELYMEGNSGRTVGRLLKISKNMCLMWIRQKAKKIKPKDRSNERVEVIEMDELFTFKERKNSNLHYDSCQEPAKKFL